MMKLVKATTKYPGIYRGKVVMNDEEQATLPAGQTAQKWGRVKVRVYPMFGSEEIQIDALPWAVPAYPMFGGAGQGFGFFAVPKVDSMVWCFFEDGDPMSPVYFAEAPDGVNGLPSEKDAEYPDAVVWKTEDGHIFYVDPEEIKVTHASGHMIMMSEDEVRVKHSGGSLITIDKMGVLKISAVNELRALATKKVVINSPLGIMIDSAVGVKVNSGLLLDFGGNLGNYTQTLLGTGLMSTITNPLGTLYSFASGLSVGSLAQIGQNLTGLTSQFTGALDFAMGSLGDLVNGDYFSIDFINDTVKSIVGIDVNGIFVKHGLNFNQIYSGLLPSDVLSRLEFSIDQSIPGGSIMDVFLDGNPLAAGVPCVSDTGAFTKSVEMSVRNALTPSLDSFVGGLSMYQGLL